MCDWLTMRLGAEYFSRGKAVSLDTYITANTQASVRLPWVYLRVLSPTKSNKFLQIKKVAPAFCALLCLVFSKVAGRWGSGPDPEYSAWYQP